MLSLEFTGRSHGDYVGVKATGFPSGEAVDFCELESFMKRRIPAHRAEKDEIEVVSGITGGVTDGNTIEIHIANTDARPSDYDALKSVPRPGHADYPAYIKYDGREDMHGGGKYSGRMTAPLCAVGGIAKQILQRRGITINAYVTRVGECSDETAFDDVIQAAKAEGDSLGGIVECVAEGLPVGVGDAMTDGLDGLISYFVFAIPACKGIEFGNGFKSASMKGSKNNDPYRVADGRVEIMSNNAGGILGGMSTGAPVVFRAAFKPTPSIAKKQHSVDLSAMQNVDIEINGRHDVCVALRAAPAVEASCAIAILSAMYGDAATDNSIDALRSEVDRTDREIAALLSKRFSLTDAIGTVKTGGIEDTGREQRVLENVRLSSADNCSDEIEKLYSHIFTLSKKRQEDMRNDG